MKPHTNQWHMQSLERVEHEGETVDVGTERSYEFYRVALEGQSFPCAFVDRDRLDANAEAIRARADGLPVRVASKSVRCLSVLDRVLAMDGFEGLMCYSGHEACYLAEAGFDDLLIAYPLWGGGEIEAACDAIERGASVQVMVDSVEHVTQISEIAADRGIGVPLCLDLDLSTEHFGIHFGVRRSGIQTPEAALSVCEAASETPAVEIRGLMGYESQLAGMPDYSPGNNPVMNAGILTPGSQTQACQRRPSNRTRGIRT